MKRQKTMTLGGVELAYLEIENEVKQLLLKGELDEEGARERLANARTVMNFLLGERGETPG